MINKILGSGVALLLLTGCQKALDVALVPLDVAVGSVSGIVDRGHRDTLLHASCANPHVSDWRICQMVRVPGTASAQNHDNQTPLFAALEFGRSVEVIQAFLDTELDLRHRDQRGNTAVEHAVLEGRDCETIELLLAHMHRRNELQPEWQSLIGKAFQADRPDVVELLLNIKWTQISSDKEMFALLPMAAQQRASSCIAFLGKRGMDFERATSDGFDPVSIALSHGYLDVAALLINGGAAVSEASKKQHLLYQTAVVGHSTDLFDALVRAGIPGVEARNSTGYTALHSACSRGLATFVEALLRIGADVNAVTGSGDTPLHLAIRCGNYSLVPNLILVGADLDVKNRYGNTALYEAVVAGYLPVVVHLVEAGSDLTAKNVVGESLVARAAKQSDSRMFDYLMSCARAPKVSLE